MPWATIKKKCGFKDCSTSTLRKVVETENKYATKPALMRDSYTRRAQNEKLFTQFLIEKIRFIKTMRLVSVERENHDKREIERLERDLANRVSEIADLTAQLGRLGSDSAIERGRLSTRICELEGQLKLSEETLANVRNERDGLMQTKKQLESMCARLQDRCTSLEVQCAKESNPSRELVAERDKLKKQVETLQDNLDQMYIEKKDFLDYHEKKIKELEDEMGKLYDARVDDEREFQLRVRELEKRVAEAEATTKEKLRHSDQKLRSYVDMLDWCTKIYSLIEEIGDTNGRDEHGTCWIFYNHHFLLILMLLQCHWVVCWIEFASAMRSFGQTYKRILGLTT